MAGEMRPPQHHVHKGDAVRRLLFLPTYSPAFSPYPEGTRLAFAKHKAALNRDGVAAAGRRVL